MSKGKFSKKRQEREKARSAAYKRSTRPKKRKPRLLIVCEGKKTEVSYFKEIVSTHKLSTANISILHDGSAPISVVEGAIKKFEEDPDFDHIYCVFDRDEHKTFDQAVNKAKQYNKAKITPIISNRQFEFWFILHFSESTRTFLDSNSIEKHLETLIQEHNKSGFKYSKNFEGMYSLTRDNVEIAIKRSKSIIKIAEENGEQGYPNPSTLVHILVEVLLNLAE